MQFRFEQFIELPRATVFAFHENPEHLTLVHRGWSDLRLLHHDGRLHPGSRTWVEATIVGILPIVMGFEHTVYEPPHRFGEQLIHGPFRKFTHIHEFDEVNTGTIVRDLLEVELPWYYGGEWVMKVFLATILKRTFQCRGAALLQLVQTGDIGQRAEG